MQTQLKLKEYVMQKFLTLFNSGGGGAQGTGGRGRAAGGRAGGQGPGGRGGRTRRVTFINGVRVNRGTPRAIQRQMANAER